MMTRSVDPTDPMALNITLTEKFDSKFYKFVQVYPFELVYIV